MMNLAYDSNHVRVVAVFGALATFIPGIVEAGNADKRLIERGRHLFMNETFNGNGRTCATCHPASNNFTIDPAFIAGLPDDDPLFVAEFNPDLAELEDPELMRRFGLILENLDGFDQPPVFRGVPHTLGLRVSTAVDPEGDANLTRADGSTVASAMGWSGDGAPGDGSLRSFATGAVIQHFPKTLNRAPGQDFRLPTEAELDALEAFQLSLGRQTELDLAALNFADPDVQAGKDLFNGVGINRSCAACHNNAGANNAAGFNRNFATNAANLADTGARHFDPELPGDGGFDAGPEFEVPGMAVHFRGNGSMNTPSVVEAADTAPLFHNNSAETIEDAVRFYTTPTFSADNAFELNDAQIRQVAAFLRALNALDNIRNASVLAKDAQRQRSARARQTIEVVMADTEDAIEVLTHGPLAPLYSHAVADLDDAYGLAENAHRAKRTPLRNASLRQAMHLMEGVPDLILQPEAGPEVADEDEDAGAPKDRAADEGAAEPPANDQAASEGDSTPDDTADAPPQKRAQTDGGPPEDTAKAAPQDQAKSEGDGAPEDTDKAAPQERAKTEADAAPEQTADATPQERAASEGGPAASDGDLTVEDGEATVSDADPVDDRRRERAKERRVVAAM